MTTDATAGKVAIERRGEILIVRLDREAKRNAVDRPMAEALERALDELEDSPQLRVGIIAGGRTVFSAGSDLHDYGNLRMPRGGEYGVIRRKRRKPLIAAVEGLALGGGLEVVLACDLVVASASAYFGLPEARRGTLAASGALFRATKALPPNVARELLLTGRHLTAERAWHLGFVNELTADGKALDRACAMATEVCQAAPTSVAYTLDVLRAVSEHDEQIGWFHTKEAMEQVRVSADMQEGVSAFFEKRPPRWTAAGQ
jgi:enoyl-CoA hydratase/carnithine racemase